MDVQDDVAYAKIAKKIKFVSMGAIFLFFVGESAKLLYYPTILKACVAARWGSEYTDDQITALTSYYKGGLDMANSLLGFLAGPIIGALSDKFGRRLPLMLCFVSSFIETLLVAVSIFYQEVWIVALGRALGFLSNTSITIMVAICSDVCLTSAARAPMLGIIMVGVAAAIIVGPASLGVLGLWGIQWSFLVALVAAVWFLLLVVGFLPEPLNIKGKYGQSESPSSSINHGAAVPSQPPSNKVSFRDLNPIRSARILFSRHLPFLGFLAVFQFFGSFAEQDIASTFVLWTDLRFHFTSLILGLMMSFYGVLMCVAQGWFFGFLTSKIGIRRSFVVGIICSILARVGYISSVNMYILIAAIPFACMSSTSTLAINVLTLKELDKDSTSSGQTGGVLGSMTSLGSLAGFLGAVVAQTVFAYFVSGHAPVYFIGAQFVLSLALYSLLLIATLVAMSWFKDTDPPKTDPDRQSLLSGDP
eukprot:TRINITY_DN8139_c0_g1_i1.p1 TRINITY_DN8139_c0_g1~~TRINITY_DN8139_c0_g1_i1.p1  ORF type:complete len:475 (+),score=75.16 TRINITY_DN8139_c0_g1_i1:34-1458(+)